MVAPSEAVIACNNLAQILLEEDRNLPTAFALSQFAFAASEGRPYRAETAETFAHALFRSGHVQAAEKVAQFAVELKPELATARYRLAAIQTAANKKEQALAECREALRLEPDFKDADKARRLIQELQRDLETTRE